MTWTFLKKKKNHLYKLARVPFRDLSTQDLHFVLPFASLSTVNRNNFVSSLRKSLHHFENHIFWPSLDKVILVWMADIVNIVFPYYVTFSLFLLDNVSDFIWYSKVPPYTICSDVIHTRMSPSSPEVIVLKYTQVLSSSFKFQVSPAYTTIIKNKVFCLFGLPWIWIYQIQYENIFNCGFFVTSIHFSSSITDCFSFWNDQQMPFYKSILAQMESIKRLLNQYLGNLISS